MENLDHLLNFNMGHLILSPHPQDEGKFKQFVPFIINWLETKKSVAYYSISEELGENKHYHLDILIFSKSEINKNILNNKGKYKGLQGELKDHAVNNLPNSRWEIYYQYKNENKNNSHEYNLKFMIGYNSKETEKYSHINEEGYDVYLDNWNNLNIDEKVFMDCVKFYEENETKSKYIIEKDVIPLTSKNAMFELKKFIKDKKNYEINDIKLDTLKKGYCWIGLSKRQIRQLILQLKIYTEQENEYERAEYISDQFPEFKDDIVEQLNLARYGNPEKRLQILHNLKFITTQEYYNITGCYP